MSFKKLIGKIHLWLGLSSGIIVLIISISGCLLAFEEEIKALIFQYRQEVEVNENAPKKLLSENLHAAQLVAKDIPINRIEVVNERNRSYIFKRYTFVPDEEAGSFYWEDTEHYYEVFINPYTAEVVEAKDQTFGFSRFLVSLHIGLLLRHEVGTQIVGYSTLIFVIMLITGLILWWPRNKKAFKVGTWFRWKSDTKWKRKNYDLHQIVGFYSMFLVIFIALTGLMWAFTWFNDGVQWIVNGGDLPEKERQIIESGADEAVLQQPLDIVYYALQTRHPGAHRYHIGLPQDSLGTIGAFVDYKDNTRDAFLQFDRYNGVLLQTREKWEDKTNGEKLMAYNYDIHTGAIGGWVGKTIAFFLSLFSASLPITGFIIWWGRRNKNQGPGKMKISGKGQGNQLTNNPRPRLKHIDKKPASNQEEPVLKY
ncbi:MAG: PepSY-associated TM helix domain-containing protein [Bacteroidota bacterium]